MSEKSCSGRGFCDVGLCASQRTRRPGVGGDCHVWANLEDSVQLRGVVHSTRCDRAMFLAQ